MGIGTGIFLFVVGAIVAFALNFQIAAINIHLIGYILMGAGVVVFAISLALTLRHHSSVSTTRTGVDSTNNERVVQQETKRDGIR